MIEHINIIDALSDQIGALLNLMQCSEDGVDHQSIKTAAEMCANMHAELMAEIDEMQKDWKTQREDDLK